MHLFLFTGLALATTNQAVSPQTGIVGAQIMRSPVCSTYADKTCLEFVNNSTEAVQIGVSYVDATGPRGIDNAIVTESGRTQCVFATGPNGTRCVSVLGPGEEGWMVFPSVTVVNVEVTGWVMPGLQMESPSVVPGAGTPAVVLGNPYLIAQGTMATQAWSHSCDVDMNVRGNNTLYVNMCH